MPPFPALSNARHAILVTSQLLAHQYNSHRLFGMDKFQYQPLRCRDSIRLLRLDPAASRDSDLKGSLIHTTISECVYNLMEPYTALSYCWGGSEKSCNVCLDDHVVGVTATLDAALRDMRDYTRPRRIWADALCINQTDDNEKSHQVSMMGDIYRAANHTIIHLGLSDPMIHAFLARFQPRFEPETIIESLASLALQPMGQSRGEATNAEDLTGLRNRIFAAPWFTRAWVFQELVLSQDPWVQCGPYRARWIDISNTLGLDYVTKAMRFQISKDKSSKWELEGKAAQVNPFTKMNERQAEKYTAPLSSILRARRGIQATDPRDLIYANLGITSDPNVWKKYFAVDYTLSVETLFNEVARYMAGTSNIDFLFFEALTFKPGLCGSSLASWAPDWTSTARRYNVTSVHGPETHYRADDEVSVRDVEIRGVHCVTTKSPWTLCFTGRRLEVVRTISLAVPDTPQEASSVMYQTDHDRRFRQWERFRDVGAPNAWSGRWIHKQLCSRVLEARKRDYLNGPFSIDYSDTLFDALDDEVAKYLGANSTNYLAGNKIVLGSLNEEGGAQPVFVVPPETKKGDILVEIGTSYVVLVLRPAEQWRGDRVTRLDDEIRRAFDAANDGPGKVPFAETSYLVTGRVAKFINWEYDSSSYHIGHYVVVGKCFLTTLCKLPPMSASPASKYRKWDSLVSKHSSDPRMEVFVLH
ncbi:heterokaryon incompatibility protein-domain-containing protein [Triangularia verruculosa]|uniref:Heterokaryon incompatibility protein-domain-containing protein n=1 Tax=Triangularia verruculosa TaxID=2587418 RepID=A0AAN6X8G0_9PEZI|nr:heterokaryon incompatibility protein-domain-containing protein [Triangularia verruculosa]